MYCRLKYRLLWLLVILGGVHLFLLSVLQTYTPLQLKDLLPQLNNHLVKPAGIRSAKIDVITDDHYKLYRVGKIDVNMTVVTAFFDIGDFVKGRKLMTRRMYAQFSNYFAYFMNPVIMYTDSKPFYNHMRRLRANLTKITKVFFVNRQDLWSFNLVRKIGKIYRQKNYPRFYPNTVKPEYSAAQHAKYELLGDTVRRHFFNTEFYCWLDFAYFRDIRKEKYDFAIVAPSSLNKSRVAFTEIFKADMDESIDEIVLTDKTWIGGGMFIGRRDNLLRLEKEYKSAVNYLLHEDLMNTDQQVLYVMYSNPGRLIFKPETKLQVYPSMNNWFRLGYLCYRRIRMWI